MSKMSEKNFLVYIDGKYVGMYPSEYKHGALLKASREHGFKNFEDHIQKTDLNPDDFTTRRPGDFVQRVG